MKTLELGCIRIAAPGPLFSSDVTPCNGYKKRCIQHAEGRHIFPDWRVYDAASEFLHTARCAPLFHVTVTHCNATTNLTAAGLRRIGVGI